MSEWPQRQWADNFTYLGLLLTTEICRVYQSHRRQGKLISFKHIDGDAEEKSGQSLKDYKSEFYVAK